MAWNEERATELITLEKYDAESENEHMKLGFQAVSQGEIDVD